jgi:hypothetical protein
LNLCASVTAAVALALCVPRIVFSLRQALSPASAPPFARPLVGTTLTLPLVTARPVTAVLWVSTKCKYCSLSLPFYRRLSDLAASAPHSFQIVGLVSEGRTEGSSYFGSNGMKLEVRTAAGVVDHLGLSGTPTLILVDAKETIIGLWPGLLDEAQQAAVLSSIRRLCPACSG